MAFRLELRGARTERATIACNAIIGSQVHTESMAFMSSVCRALHIANSGAQVRMGHGKAARVTFCIFGIALAIAGLIMFFQTFSLRTGSGCWRS